ncbi:MAG: VWA domain-containing protein [Deltaproteobacteria bacterium]|nr:VWA domain-containing protein [Deltaproteobacteria bacterium]
MIRNSCAFFGPLALLLLVAPGQASAQTRTQAPTIELAFALDATGSMGSWIGQARAQIRAIADELRSGDPAPNIRFALVSYRDKSDDYVTRVHDFTTDVDEMQRYLDGTQARGGGDTPEALLEGVHAAIGRLSWSPVDQDAIRLLYVVGDAPAKHYPETPTEGALAELARGKHIVIHTLACGRLTGDAEVTFADLARFTEGRQFDIANLQRMARTSGAGGAPTSALAAAVSAATRAYSEAVGVDFDSAETTSLESTAWAEGPSLERSGLVGRHVRWVRDLVTWNDLWSAHVSLMPEDDRPPPPEVDFTSHHVLVLGGQEQGLELESVQTDGTRRWARVRPTPGGQVRFALVSIPPTAANAQEER